MLYIIIHKHYVYIYIHLYILYTHTNTQPFNGRYLCHLTLYSFNPKLTFVCWIYLPQANNWDYNKQFLGFLLKKAVLYLKK